MMKVLGTTNVLIFSFSYNILVTNYYIIKLKARKKILRVVLLLGMSININCIPLVFILHNVTGYNLTLNTSFLNGYNRRKII